MVRGPLDPVLLCLGPVPKEAEGQDLGQGPGRCPTAHMVCLVPDLGPGPSPDHGPGPGLYPCLYLCLYPCPFPIQKGGAWDHPDRIPGPLPWGEVLPPSVVYRSG